MTVTETRPDTAQELLALAPAPRPEPAGLHGYVGTGDHKKIGRLYIGLSLVFLLAMVLFGALLGVELIDQGGYEVFDAASYFQALTFGAQGLVALVIVPLLLGLGIYVVPLQVGARSIALPRATAASFWGYLFGGSLVIGSYAINGGPGGGDAQAVDLWIVAYGMLILSLLVATVCVVTTVLTLRTSGMYLDRVPLFSWSMVVAGLLWLCTLPVLLAALVLAYLDHRYGRLGIGGNYDLYAWLHWSIRPPQVFAYAIPALGIIGEIVPVMAGTRQRRHMLMMGLIGFFGVLSFGAFTIGTWQQLTSEVWAGSTQFSVYDEWVFVGVALLLPLPLLALLGGWTESLVRGRERQFSAPLVAALVAGVVLLAAVGAAAVEVIGQLDLLESAWPAGVAHLALLGTLVGALAGLEYWSVKIFAHPVPKGAGIVVALLAGLGALLVGAGDLLAGFYDQPDPILFAGNPATAPFAGVLEVRDAVEVAAVLGVAGWALFGGAVVLFLLAFVGAVAAPRDEVVPADPWSGHTLEWATSSPPAVGNFVDVALVTSPAPLLDEREATGGGKH